MGILVGSFHPLATSTRHTGEWLTDRNILRVKDLRNQPPARRHSPRTHSVQLSTATPRWNDCFKNQKPYASDEMLRRRTAQSHWRKLIARARMTLGGIPPKVDRSASSRPEQPKKTRPIGYWIGLLSISKCYPGLNHAANSLDFQS